MVVAKGPLKNRSGPGSAQCGPETLWIPQSAKSRGRSFGQSLAFAGQVIDPMQWLNSGPKDRCRGIYGAQTVLQAPILPAGRRAHNDESIGATERAPRLALTPKRKHSPARQRIQRIQQHDVEI